LNADRKIWSRLLAVVLAAMMMLGISTTALASPGFSFTLADGGRRVDVFTRGETVGAMLDRLERPLGELDTINLDLNHRLATGDVVSITRRAYVTVTETRPIAYSTVFLHSPEIRAGTERVVQEGQNGISELTVNRFVVNGEVIEEEIVRERVIQPTVDRRVEMGFRSQPMSPFDFGMEFDENHEPIGYIQVFRNMIATAYTATGNRTSLGYWPVIGHVAVNPNVIPYRSRLFIQTPDGSFIYGYALAVDTGGDLLRGRIDIDLFFCCDAMAWQHGVRRMDVFILPPAN